ncbi:alpha-mannosidase [Lactobacillus sp. ESL0684]|uniref:glycoside hydrolase family 38 N-terminal domain-containing protein n=1 Tax=unclassified Lactobacillus TaxID=2620435 RepID=UPI0023F7CC26|nr:MULTISPECIES: glycoside hydrolase family 38 C-terminal domain-containing protein [unclassified Lactobacillus]WEV39632.1 alpha-mannosidase [Lactobacillus sp. ESL0681]WEV43844.1 alpha-mannosidase [Lactobacillus sp. ESL0684]
MVKQVYIVPHTHWDREWFFSAAKAKVYLLKDLKDVINLLENNEDYKCFLLDGQASLIVDYLHWRPQDMDRVKKLVQTNKLNIGPWYTQTDQYLVSGESIVNNLLIGMQKSERLGGYLNVAYVPDSFGQESSMPQIYQDLGITDAVLYRGFSTDNVKKSEFIWQGEDGSKINVYRMAAGYFVGGVIDETKLKEIMEREPFKIIPEQATTNNLLLPNGSDMAPIRFDLPSFVDKLNKSNSKYQFKISTIMDYINAVKADDPNLVVLSGEQDCGRDMRVHKSIYSSRADIKKYNTKLQYYLSNIMEPLLVMGDYFDLEYPRAAVQDIWKKMFENAAHDSMGNCVSDAVNEDIKLRYKQVADIATGLVDITLRQIATKISNNDNPITLTVFNTLPFVRNDVVNKTLYSPSRNFKLQANDGSEISYEVNSIKDVTELILGSTIQLDPGREIYYPKKVYEINIDLYLTNIPAFGYRQCYLLPLEDSILGLNKPKKDSVIENDFYKIKANQDGSLDILDKLNNYNYRNQAIIEENGDDGDSYNYSPPEDDLVIYSTEQENRIRTYSNKLRSKIIICFDFKVPSNLQKRAKKITDVSMPVKLEVSLNQSSKIINFKIDIDNRWAKSHRLCVNFDSQIMTKVSIADIQFGSIKRPLVKERELAEWSKSPDNWQERPISINTMQSFVALSQKTRCMGVVSNGVREYECVGIDNRVIRLTIFRTYGMLGKRDLLYRPGRASGDETVPTPAAQLNKKLSFDFALILEQTEYDQTDLANIVKEFETPLLVYEYAEFLNGRLTFPFNPVSRSYEQEFSLFKTDGNLTISTIEKSQQGAGYIVRLYNPLFHVVTDRMIFAKHPKLVQLVNLKGNKIKDLTIKANIVEIPQIEHAKFVTIYFEV